MKKTVKTRNQKNRTQEEKRKLMKLKDGSLKRSDKRIDKPLAQMRREKSEKYK